MMDNPSNIIPSKEGSLYRVRIKGLLPDGWVHALQLDVVTTQRHDVGVPTTTLLLRVIDQAELMGVLYRLHGMNFTLLALEQWHDEAPLANH